LYRENSEGQEKKMGKRQIVLSLSGIFILMLVLLSVSFSPVKSKAFSIPNQIGSFSLTTKLEGDEAMAQISHLHGKDIQIQNGYILEYENGQGSAIVWISESSSVIEAKKLFNKMNRLMDKSQMYSNHQSFEINGTMLQYVFGMNMDNFYYQKDSQVIWISAPTEKNQEFIKNWLKAF
jgi:hypothetical protein